MSRFGIARGCKISMFKSNTLRCKLLLTVYVCVQESVTGGDFGVISCFVSLQSFGYVLNKFLMDESCRIGKIDKRIFS